MPSIPAQTQPDVPKTTGASIDLHGNSRGGPTSQQDLGIFSMVSDGAADATGGTPINSILTRAASTGKQVLFTPGLYKIDNTGGPLVINNLRATLTMRTGASLQCTTNTRMCLQFVGGTGAILDGVTIAYPSNAVVRADGAVGLFFYQTTDTKLMNPHVVGSAGPLIQFQESIRPLVSGSLVTDGMADGLDFFNCQDARVSDHIAKRTGDDGLAFVNYSIYQDYNGGVATNITVDGSNARGIAVDGASGIEVNGFHISNTTNAGVMCLSGGAFGTRTTTGTKFSNGAITNPGTYLPPNSQRPNGITGIPTGISWDFGGDTGSCEFANIEVSGVTGNAGFGPSNTPRAVSGSNGAFISLHDITIDGVSGDGVNAGALHLDIQRVVVKHATGYAYFLNGYGNAGAAIITGDNLMAYNCGSGLTGGRAGRAIGIEHNAKVMLTSLKIIDDQATPTGYIVEEFTNAAGSIKGIQSLIDHGTFQTQSASADFVMQP